MRPETSPGLAIRRVPIGELHADPANVNTHDESNLRQIRGSLQEFGQVEPLVVQAGSGKVIGGNGRLDVMRELGFAECDVVEFDGGDVRATALAIALNRTAKTSVFDDEALARTLRALQDEDFDLGAVGFTDAEVDALFGTADEAEQTETLSDDSTVADDDDRFVAFKFGDYSGRISREVYDSFVVAYQARQVESGEPMMDDVLRAWLDV
jgi:hypothetical protein